MKIPARCAILVVCMVLSVAEVQAAPEHQVVQEWRFSQEGDLLGWSAGGHIEAARVERGALRGRAAGWDPILLGPVFEIRSSPTQYVDIRMRCQQTGRGELFWTETLEGRYGGFSQEKSAAFSAVGDGQFHDYRVYPFWHAAGKVIRLRVDVPPDGEFEIEAIRVVDMAAGPPEKQPHWSMATDGLRWQPMQQIESVDVSPAGLALRSDGNRPILLSPALEVNGRQKPFVCVRMAVSAGTFGRIYAVGRTQLGWEDLSFPLRADGRLHTYNVDMGGLRRWQGEVILVGLQPTDAAGATVRVESIEVVDDLRGPAELEVAYFGKTEGVNRAGRPAQLTLTARNLGGQTAGGASARLEAPPGIEILGPAVQALPPVSPYLPKSVNWTVRAREPGRARFKATLEIEGFAPVEAEAAVDFTPAPKLEPSGYVPEPRPVRGQVDVGAFYFPGWQNAARWAPILDFPMRKPVLGWYDESNPECADWQIKWAVEHGVTFFMVDWYWSQGSRQLDHWLHDAYAKSRYKRFLKWAVMWANHNRPGTHSLEDWRQVTQYWLDHYLKTDEYYRIDGRPAVFIWSPQNIREDLGGSDKAAKLYALSQQMARQAGLPGIYFVAMSSHDSADRCRQLKAEGYEAFTSYHGFQLAEHQLGTQYFSFEEVVRTSPQVWQDCDERASGLDYYPIVDTGWSSEPWHRASARVIHGRTPERFGRLCQAARRYADERGKRIVCLGPWNEWGEGSYIEPYAEYGFGDLDALRAAFCPPGDYPPNLVPADVGLGPYDLEFPLQKTAWEFNTSGDLEGWTPNGAVQVKAAGGTLQGVTTGDDSILSGPPVRIDARETRNLAIRVKSSRATRVQLFWGTTVLQPNETTAVGFDVPGDNQWHDYALALDKQPAWRGVIVSLRFDPATRAGAEFAVDFIRLE